MMKQKIMGLDASTTTIGLAVLEHEDFQNPKLIEVTYFKPPKKGDIFERLSKVRDFIQNRIQHFQPDQVALEDILLFMKGHSTATTISSLAVLNRTVGLAVYDKLGRPPTLLNVMKIRHAVKQGKALPAKEDIPELVAQMLQIEFPYVLNRNKKISVENYDMADAIAVALAYLKVHAPVEPAPKRASKKKEAK
jgi:Holliday junction resolvasome RuvABC endonuclease subunit